MNTPCFLIEKLDERALRKGDNEKNWHLESEVPNNYYLDMLVSGPRLNYSVAKDRNGRHKKDYLENEDSQYSPQTKVVIPNFVVFSIFTDFFIMNRTEIFCFEFLIYEAKVYSEQSMFKTYVR